MSEFKQVCSPQTLAALTQRVREVALHRFLGMTITHQEPGLASLELPGGEPAANPNRVVHGGVIMALLDTVSYLALLPLLAEGEDAVTHDAHVSVLRPAPAGETVEFRGKTVRRGKTLTFSDAEAYCQGKLIATARITKSIVPMNSFG